METALSLKREWFSDTCTIGKLHIDGAYECLTLEDTVRKDGLKITGRTAIPTGRYEVAFSFSPRLKMFLPLIMDVPNFTRIRIHAGNTDKDTEGCLLVGREKAESNQAIYQSRAALGLLMEKLEKAMHRGPVYITIL